MASLSVSCFVIGPLWTRLHVREVCSGIGTRGLANYRLPLWNPKRHTDRAQREKAAIFPGKIFLTILELEALRVVNFTACDL